VLGGLGRPSTQLKSNDVNLYFLRTGTKIDYWKWTLFSTES